MDEAVAGVAAGGHRSGPSADGRRLGARAAPTPRPSWSSWAGRPWPNPRLRSPPPPRCSPACPAWPSWRPAPLNVHGALDMGLAPGVLPGRVGDRPGPGLVRGGVGGTLPARPGLDTAGMLASAAAGRLGGLVLVGADPAADFPDAGVADAGSEGARFVVAMDTFLNSSSRQADVVLPAATYANGGGRSPTWRAGSRGCGQMVTPPGRGLDGLDDRRRAGRPLGCRSRLLQPGGHLGRGRAGLTAARRASRLRGPGQPPGARRHRGTGRRRRSCRVRPPPARSHGRPRHRLPGEPYGAPDAAHRGRGGRVDSLDVRGASDVEGIGVEGARTSRVHRTRRCIGRRQGASDVEGAEDVGERRAPPADGHLGSVPVDRRPGSGPGGDGPGWWRPGRLWDAGRP